MAETTWIDRRKKRSFEVGLEIARERSKNAPGAGELEIRGKEKKLMIEAEGKNENIEKDWMSQATLVNDVCLNLIPSVALYYKYSQCTNRFVFEHYHIESFFFLNINTKFKLYIYFFIFRVEFLKIKMSHYKMAKKYLRNMYTLL